MKYFKADYVLPITAKLNNDNEKSAVEKILTKILTYIEKDFETHKFSFVEKILEDELVADVYGNRAGEIFRLLSPYWRKKFVKILRRQEESQGREIFFTIAIQDFFPGTKIYFYDDEERFLLCLPYSQTESGDLILELAEILFMDFTCATPKVFWDEHFGIIGEPLTMRLDEMIVY